MQVPYLYLLRRFDIIFNNDIFTFQDNSVEARRGHNIQTPTHLNNMMETNLDINFHDEINLGQVSGDGTRRRQVRNLHRRNNRGERCRHVSSHSALNVKVHAQDPGLNIHTSRNMVELFQQMSSFHQVFCAEYDKLSIVQMCNACHESYPRMNVFRQDEGPICVRCRQEHGIHRFSQDNNINPGK